MILSVVDWLPEDWKVTVTVVRPAGEDETDGWGDRLPSQRLPLAGCLLSVQTSTDPLDHSQVPTTHVVLSAPTRSGLRRGDEIEVPAGSPMAGRYAVIGDPMPGPLGDSALLDRVADRRTGLGAVARG